MKKAHFLLGFTLVLLACSREPDPSQWPLSAKQLNGAAGDSDGAERTYQRYCVGCHGNDGRGNGGITGLDFTLPNGPLTSKPSADLVASVRDGKRGEKATMPAHKPVLSEAQISAVVAYVQKRFATPAAATPAP